MTLERIFGKVVFYIIELVVKGFIAYLAYCGLNAFTDNGLGSFYIATAIWMTLIVLGWNMEKISNDAIEPYEEPEEPE